MDAAPALPRWLRAPERRAVARAWARGATILLVLAGTACSGTWAPGTSGSAGPTAAPGTTAPLTAAPGTTAPLIAAPGTTAPPAQGAPAVTAPSEVGPATSAAAAPLRGAPLSESDRERRSAVADLVTRRAAALAARSRPGWMATVDDPSSPYGLRQAALFDRMTLLPIAGYTQDAVAPAPTPPRVDALGAEAWVASVRMSYQLAGYDRAPRGYEASYTLVRRASGWKIADDTDGATESQPWDLPNLAVASSPSSLVIGDIPLKQLQEYRATADAAAARIGAVWGSAAPTVLVAPATLEQFASQSGRGGGGGTEQVAGVTNGPFLPGAVATSDRVYLNPQAFARLTTDGRRVVITHELTHVAVRASTTRPSPIWLSEGFADYVAFLGLTIPPARVAADLLGRVRSGSGPTALPSEADFDPAHGTISPTYNAAWLAVTRMAQRHGQAKVVEFYRAVVSDPSVPPETVEPEPPARRAFRTVLGTTQEAFVADWLAYLARLAG